MQITWLGHACFLVEDSRGTRVITDPFAVDPKMFAERGLKFDFRRFPGSRPTWCSYPTSTSTTTRPGWWTANQR